MSVAQTRNGEEPLSYGSKFVERLWQTGQKMYSSFIWADRFNAV